MTKANALIIAKPRFDALTCDVKDQVFNSQYNSLKIWMTGNTSISVPAFSGFEIDAHVDIPHNLGYSPFFLCYFKLKHASKLWLQDSLDASALTANYISGHAYSNDTNVRAYVTVNGDNLGAWTATVYYKILIDKAYE
jgi:hypothetical protein